MQQCVIILLFLMLNEAQHVSGPTPPIIRSLKLHKQPLVLHNILGGCRTCRCWTLSGSVYFSMLKLFYYILVYGAQRLLMLDGDRLILLDVMKNRNFN